MSTNETPVSGPAAGRSSGPLDQLGLWLWRQLNSLPVAIWVMLLLAFFSMLGTIIPQTHLAQPPAGISLDEMYLQRYGEAKAQLIRSFGFDRVYFTWYFNALLLWLSVSAVVCNIVRYQRTVRMWREPAVKRGAGFFTADKRALAVSAAPPQALDQIAAELKAARFRIVEAEHNGARCLYADRGFLRKWSLVLLHFAVLVLLFGGMYGKAVGVESNVMMADGEKKDLTLDILNGKVEYIKPLLKKLPPLTYNLDQQTYRIDYLKQIRLPQDAEGMPEEFKEYYRYIVRDYISNLTVKKGELSVQKEVKVNHPLVIDKLVIYQSGYQQNGYLAIDMGNGPEDFQILPGSRMAMTPRGLAIQDMPGGPWMLPVPDTNFSKVTRLPEGTPVSDLSFEFEPVKAGDFYDGGVESGYIGPMTIVTFYDTQTGQSLGSQLINPQTGFDFSIEGQRLRATMSERIDNYSIFSYKRDPGIPILYFGWICMIVGVAMTMYVGFTQFWARQEPERLLLLASGPALSRGSALAARVHALLGEAQISAAARPAGSKDGG